MGVDTVLLYTIDSSYLIDQYKKQLNINIERCVHKVDQIQVWRCLATGYEFFYPLNIAGDGKFYEDLSSFDWYYMPWKWEHQIAKSLVKENDKVLEIGCADGNFLVNIKPITPYLKGLELNEKALKKGLQSGLDVELKTIEEFAKTNANSFDFICTFQVVEHIADIKPFIDACLLTLKIGGKLLISVPNNNSFLGLNRNNILNMPPHHMGRWNETSLQNLEKYFPMKMLNTYIEPLQAYHYESYFKVASDIVFKKYGKIGRYIFKRFKGLFRPLFSQSEKLFKGFTIIGVYEKI